MRTPDFDPIARPYRWLEYLSLGRALERCRFYFLPQLSAHRRALVLGDGDGRFLSRLLARNPHLTADAVDTSAAMLTLLRSRCRASATRLSTHHCDAQTFLASLPSTSKYDLIVTHFFLDCFTQPDLDTLAQAIAVQTIAARSDAPATWLVSDFRIPSGPLRLPARIFVRSLYFAFRLITGLRTRSLPDHASSLTSVGFTRITRNLSRAGLLTTELWIFDRP